MLAISRMRLVVCEIRTKLLIDTRTFARVTADALELPVSDYTIYVVMVFFFFFQAEDGIRDVAVTGVQTCALPICNFNRSKCRRRYYVHMRDCYNHQDRKDDGHGDPSPALVAMHVPVAINADHG